MQNCVLREPSVGSGPWVRVLRSRFAVFAWSSYQADLCWPLAHPAWRHLEDCRLPAASSASLASTSSQVSRTGQNVSSSVGSISCSVDIRKPASQQITKGDSTNLQSVSQSGPASANTRHFNLLSSCSQLPLLQFRTVIYSYSNCVCSCRYD